MKYVIALIVEAESFAEAKLMALRGEGKLPGVSPKPELIAIPYPDWPLWAKALKQFAKPEDKGIGDVVARIIGEENSAAFSAWHLATFGKSCGCKGRQAKWNKLYPLP